MSRPVPIQVYVSPELAGRVRAVAANRDLSVSAWLRVLMIEACKHSEMTAEHAVSNGRLLRLNLFARVGIDALLAGHPDPTLRDRVHAIYARKCDELGLASTFVEESQDEA
ncbi:MAG: hypothetical protein H6918_04910 [Sphingomonadaceae bacterium]|nr:hypothetical protein [Sphingomonadaceae bacterium]